MAKIGFHCLLLASFFVTNSLAMAPVNLPPPSSDGVDVEWVDKKGFPPSISETHLSQMNNQKAGAQACQTDKDCGPESVCNVAEGTCHCHQGFVPGDVVDGEGGKSGSIGGAAVGCVRVNVTLGSPCTSDMDCSENGANPGYVCLARERKCRCGRGFDTDGENTFFLIIGTRFLLETCPINS